MTNSTVTGNAGGDGGGIFCTISQATIQDSIVSDNVASKDAGGILSTYTSTLTLINTTISGNQAEAAGGGIYDQALHTILVNSTVQQNTAGSAVGGVYNYFSKGRAVTQCAIISNTAVGNGGGLYNYGGMLTMANSTFSGNDGGTGAGAIRTLEGNVTLFGSIISGDSGSDACVIESDDNLVSKGYNFASDATCNLNHTSDLPPSDPRLGSLADNGGATWTHLPQATSRALDQIPVADCPVAVDQRGSLRPTGDACDIGVVERNVGGNRPPVADACVDQAVVIGSVVQLDGSGSYDPEGQQRGQCDLAYLHGHAYGHFHLHPYGHRHVTPGGTFTLLLAGSDQVVVTVIEHNFYLPLVVRA
jgi:hypothetical protein